MWGDGGFMGLGGGFMLLFWVLLILLIVWLVRATLPASGGAPGREKSAMDILKERYARGEIDKEEFESMRKDLMR